MDNPAIAAKLRNIFTEELGIESEEVTDELQYNVASEWDSSAHMYLITAIEEQFEIQIPDDDVVEMTSYPKAVAIVTRLVDGNS